MSCSIEQENMFTIRVDMQGLSTIERALSFYAERAILPDGDPTRDLSRQFTALLLRMGRVDPAKAVGGPGAPVLPPTTGEVPAVADAAVDAGEGDESPEETPEAPPAEPNPLEAELESMMGDQPAATPPSGDDVILPTEKADVMFLDGDPREGGTD
jgi:hypothetical protein